LLEVITRTLWSLPSLDVLGKVTLSSSYYRKRGGGIFRPQIQLTIPIYETLGEDKTLAVQDGNLEFTFYASISERRIDLNNPENFYLILYSAKFSGGVSAPPRRLVLPPEATGHLHVLSERNEFRFDH